MQYHLYLSRYLVLLPLFLFTLLTPNMAEAKTPPPAATPPPSTDRGLSAFAPVMGGLSLLPAPFSMFTYTGVHSTSIDQQRLSILTPLYRDEKNRFTAMANAANLHLDRGPILRKTGTKVPTEFYRTEVGGHYSHELSDARHLALRGSLGYASDKPFQDKQDLIFNLNGSYSFPGNEYSFWALTLFVSNNSPIANYIPIPGFLYFYKKNNLTGVFGLPMASLQWKPVQPWAFSFFLFGPTINLEAAYSLENRMQLFVASNWSQQSFFRSSRTRQDDRIIFEEKRGVLGLKSPLGRTLHGEAQIGYAFDRSIYEGDGFLNRDRGSAPIDDSWFAQINLRYSF